MWLLGCELQAILFTIVMAKYLSLNAIVEDCSTKTFWHEAFLCSELGHYNLKVLRITYAAR